MNDMCALVLHVSLQCKEEFEKEINALTLQECECVLRIGIHGTHVLRNVCFEKGAGELKRKYGQHLTRKD